MYDIRHLHLRAERARAAAASTADNQFRAKLMRQADQWDDEARRLNLLEVKNTASSRLLQAQMTRDPYTPR
jgi:hypothetical protein